MQAKWTTDSDGRLRRETIHHMGRRLKDWDYRRPGYYVITILLEDRRAAPLGELAVKSPEGEWIGIERARSLALAPEAMEAKVVYSALGRAVFDHFMKMGEFTPGLKPVYCAVMPDHLHLLIGVESTLVHPVGNAVGGFKTGCEKIYAKLGGAGRLFARGFVDEVVLRAGQLHCEFEYLRDNPRRLAVKRLYPELFRHSREIALQLTPQVHAEREGAPIGASRSPAPPVSTAPAVPAVGRFSAIGNHFLLTRPLAQVQISRACFRYRRTGPPGGKKRIARDAQGEPIVELITPEYERRRDALLSAAKRGVALISPCISDGERQIAREALKAGYRLVTMHNKGFARLQKPSGRYFDACAQGRLLMLAPAAWPYQPNEKPMTRDDATAMNRLCQWLAGPGAAEINYHGMQPLNIDRLALAAVSASR